jgi:tetratricopeptide (TPR) repeat protein
MSKFPNTAVIAAIALGASGVAAAGAAHAAVTVFGGSFAQDCFKAAKYGDVRSEGLDNCTRAIETEMLDKRDLAGTYVNRGVVYMEETDYNHAGADFEQALKLNPMLGEAIVNRGAVLIAQRHFQDGIDEITRGLALSPEEPEKAYYNRAIAYESVDNLKAAYYDYMKASELKPNWAAPKTELARFTVTQR